MVKVMEPSEEKKRISIGIVDDHPIFRDGLRKLLSQQEDFEVVAEAGDGIEALEIVQKVEPDVLLLNLRMPKLDGLGTLQRLQTQKTNTKVILLTASDDRADFVQAMKFGVSGIVLKQSAPQLLIEAIRKVHGGEIWLDSGVGARELSPALDLHFRFEL